MTAAWHGFPEMEDLKNIKTKGNKHTLEVSTIYKAYVRG